MKRRAFLQAAGSAAVISAFAPRALAQSQTILKVGYLHVLDCDGHLWLGEHLGAWKQQGIELEKIEFVTGLEAYQALAGGSVDLVTTGAVISNFPARGQGKVFLANGLETGIAQIWAHPDQGIRSIADLKGKKIATTRGTTAHFLLHRVLKKAGLDSTKDVEIVHQRMDQAVTSFISGSVPAVVLWLPFDVQVRQHAKGAVLIAKSSDYPDATVVSGWSARNTLQEERPGVLERFVKGWGVANDFIVKQPAEALKTLGADKYKAFPLTELQSQYDAVKWQTTAGWAPAYQDGSLQRWLNQVTDFNVEVGAIKNPVRAEQYFDPQPFRRAFGSAA
jgi:NitT/TauT family transport system substrate-binding protein